MKLTALLCLGFLTSLCHGQIEEARRLVATPPDSRRLERTVELLRTGDAETKIYLAGIWHQSGEDFAAYLGELPIEGLADRLCGSAASAIVQASESDDALLRILAQSAAVDLKAEGPEVYRVDCNRAFKDFARRHPERVRKLLSDKDAQVLYSAMEALRGDHPEWVRAEAARRFDDPSKTIRTDAAEIFVFLSIPGEDDDALRQLFAKLKPDELEVARTYLGPSSMERLYEGVPFGQMPVGARYTALHIWPEAFKKDYRSVVLRDPDPEIAAEAAVVGHLPFRDIAAAMPKLLKSKQARRFEAMREFDALWRGELEAWFAWDRNFNPPVMPTEALVEITGEREGAPKMLLKLIPIADKENVDEGLWYELGTDWPKFKPVAELMLRSPHLSVRQCAAYQLMELATAPLYLKQILADPDYGVRDVLFSKQIIELYGDQILPVLASSSHRSEAFAAFRLMAADDKYRPQLRSLLSSPNAQTAEFLKYLLAR